ncbi:hypothetical protein DL98DRAFT_518533 [Cadophora sp. DSE1049]|nr:hypothetical protein DL98DRAFT_518533 [Cadophora sp. DSE1049]
MVAVQSLLSMLALAVAASAAPSVDIEARQVSVAGLKFFGPTNHNCEAGGPIVENFNVFTPPCKCKFCFSSSSEFHKICFERGGFLHLNTVLIMGFWNKLKVGSQSSPDVIELARLLRDIGESSARYKTAREFGRLERESATDKIGISLRKCICRVGLGRCGAVCCATEQSLPFI